MLPQAGSAVRGLRRRDQLGGVVGGDGGQRTSDGRDHRRRGRLGGGVRHGAARRQSIERVKRDALLDLVKARAEVEHTRAEVLAERNHLAREIHDVLAHTLSALSIKLEALDTLASQEHASPGLRAELEQTKLLVREGLNEARRAVRALRDDPAQLVDQLAKLCHELGAALVVTGTQGRSRQTRPGPLPGSAGSVDQRHEACPGGESRS